MFCKRSQVFLDVFICSQDVLMCPTMFYRRPKMFSDVCKMFLGCLSIVLGMFEGCFRDVLGMVLCFHYFQCCA